PHRELRHAGEVEIREYFLLGERYERLRILVLTHDREHLVRGGLHQRVGRLRERRRGAKKRADEEGAQAGFHISKLRKEKTSAGPQSACLLTREHRRVASVGRRDLGARLSGK